MAVTQLSVFAENRSGRIENISSCLTKAGVSIRGFSMADTTDYGIVRMVVDDPSAAREALKAEGHTVKTGEVLCLELEDAPGELSRVFDTLAAEGINIDYAYSLVGTYIALHVDDVESATKALAQTDLILVDQDRLAL